MTKFYDKRRKGMKKAKNGKFYYPKKKQSRPKSKQSMVQARQPIVETKKNQSGQSTFNLSTTSAGQFVALRSYIDMSQGISQDSMIGTSVFTKYISMKLKFQFPRDEYSIRKNYRIQLVHGWMTAPFALADTPVGAPYSPARGSVSPTELEQIVAARLGPDFNATGDDMAFREKRKRIFKVEGKQWIRPNRNAAIGFPQLFGRYAAETDHLLGGIPDVMKQLNWKPMRKTKYQLSTSTDGSFTDYYYPNENWVPFVCIFCPEYQNVAGTTDLYKVKCIVNDCHWFTDG